MDYKIPLFQLNFGEEEIQAVTDTIRSKWISTGPKCQELEEQFIEMFDVKHAISVSNCTDGLHLAMIVNNIKQGDEVICPSLTFAASVNCIRYVGATPVFCDIGGLDNMNITPAEIEKRITSKTKAIVVVHMAGFPADMDGIMALSRKHNLKVIEDTCHAPLSQYKGKTLGTIGSMGTYSFFSNKNISTGEGGMIITNDDEIAARCRLLRSHGMTTMSYQRAKGHATSYDIVELGHNFRLDDIRASIGVVQMKKLKADLDRRQNVRKYYIDALQSIDQVIVPFCDNTEYVSNYIMPIVLKDSTEANRDALRAHLHAQGIQTSNHYPPIHKFSIYKEYTTKLPVTEYVCANEITLPMYAALTKEDVEFIALTIRNFYS
ncbi:dTDP-4-amino-4,6-dideoxygalactose transaminase [Dokdonia sp. Hel_I_63]|uniref:DegT/DnrJ/EryC1/StrS family aminotransferase n=1 Tax=unclassified Dokdonia TaxID=2615033 RepID=UPI00020A6DE5|nr:MULTISPECIES: DegT/DnrJ/EryC1/StrS family aminotransferase [unclassified Dokdonia]AEE20751.1 DegT/DnrJ/EryC1/StrS aminotransferase [Dokdonia sp. 4H-3-7-5]TVZ22995.1 dTDP-4-amino-4,6-dideoxygalactose transaminase [Dokdonia sp. Hel_I_63]